MHTCLATNTSIRRYSFWGRYNARTVITDAGHRLYMLLKCTL